MSKRKSVSAPVGMPPEAGKFVAVIAWAQKNECNCPAARYFREVGKQFIEQYLGSVEGGKGGKG